GRKASRAFHLLSIGFDVLALPASVFHGSQSVFYGAIIVAWCELWSLIGLIPRKSKRRVSI
ncbi:MAG: hypothetical protein IKM00_00780, partial [Clostridia bacterium]|nr:hypothetical protein [Clostridia bacterium]